METNEAKPNREYKSSVFVDLFSEDKNARENFISLYNALHNKELPATTDIQPLRLERVLYTGIYNDASTLIDNKIIVMAEHQSTINENMPLRFLEYVARIYEHILSTRDRYLKKLVKIPCPEFYVFYNGTDDFPTSKTLRLSDAFILPNKETKLDLYVEVVNINHDKRNELLDRCQPLKEYSEFVEIVRRNVEKDKEEGFNKAIQEALKNNVLREYLQRKTKEVVNMLIAEYDYATDIAVQREEAWNESAVVHKRESKLETAREMLALNMSIENIMQVTKLSREEVEELQASR